jgi:DNA-binding CsgD family transcriptional regulator
MVDRGLLHAVGEYADGVRDRLAAQRRRRLSATLSGLVIAGALPFVELRLAEVGHGVHLLGFLVVAIGAAVALGPGHGAIVLAAGSISCFLTAIHTSDAVDLPALIPVTLYLIAGTAFLVVLASSIRLRRRQAGPAPIMPHREGSWRVPEGEGSLDQLTAREVGILRLAAGGMDVSEVAACLFLSPNTVKSHLSHAYQKLGARNRQDAIRAAIHCGCLDFSDVCPHRSSAVPANTPIE